MNSLFHEICCISHVHQEVFTTQMITFKSETLFFDYSLEVKLQFSHPHEKSKQIQQKFHFFHMYATGNQKNIESLLSVKM